MGSAGLFSRLWGREPADDAETVAAVEKRLGVRFARPRLLETALTHRSYSNEVGLDANYERLEFLGDSVLGLLAAEWLCESRPELSEGTLTEIKSRLVSREPLAEHARHLGLDEALRLGVGEERSGGRGKASLLADVLEAVLGAVYVDRGIDAARALVRPLFERTLASRRTRPRAAKTRLQELAQARGLPLPVYRLLAADGPDHEKRFTVECEVADQPPTTGEGRTKKVAEQRAARALLEALEGD